MCFLNVESIRLINFRNYNNININPNKNINVIIGKNAQGKTNLIESIYMCATGKSFRTNRDKEIINFNKDEAYVGAILKIGPHEKLIEIKMERNRPKRIRINKTELKSYKELNSGLSVVVFSPEDLKIVKEGPQERRNFLDMLISQMRPVYSYNINRYNKILFQRNNLLKSSRLKKDIISLIDVFDIQMSKIGTNIVLERQRNINELSNISKTMHNNITLSKEELSLRYISNVPILDNKVEMEKKYLELLKCNIGKDMENGSTEIGPHRDDISISINDHEVKTYGSQGQQRTAILSLKLSEVELIKKERGAYPVLLLDDVFSELDEERRRYLSKSFYKMQTFITVTDAIDLKSMDGFEKSIFYVENGKLI